MAGRSGPMVSRVMCRNGAAPRSSRLLSGVGDHSIPEERVGSLLVDRRDVDKNELLAMKSFEVEQVLRKNSLGEDDQFWRNEPSLSSLSEDLILSVLKRLRSEWKISYAFFRRVSKTKNLAINSYNEIVDTLGQMRRFDELGQVLVEMTRRKDLINESTYSIVVSRFCAAHKVDEAIGFFNRIEEFGLHRNLAAFQTLLLSLCRYKHVEAAELLFRNKKGEFQENIKSWNIILNGWCVLRSLPDAKRVWNDILELEIKPDKYTFGIFINALSKSGKISRTKKLLKEMWEKGWCAPDTTICNTVIDGLCFKNRVPEALEILSEMNERNCPPNVATYNSLIKHLCKIQRMEKVEELLNEMEEQGENCLPNALTYGYLLRTAKKVEEVDTILVRMENRGCKLETDTCNLLLRLFMKWGHQDRVKHTWDEMEKGGLGPDQQSYTVVIHGHYDKGSITGAIELYAEMVSKGMIPNSRTRFLMDSINKIRT